MIWNAVCFVMGANVGAIIMAVVSINRSNRAEPVQRHLRVIR